MSLKGNIDIFQITGKQFKPNGIEFTLHKPIRYSQSVENKIHLANKPPFGEYKVGDFLGINTEIVRWQAFFAHSKVWDDKTVVSKVVARPPQFYNKQVFKSDEFGDGWVED